MFHKLRAAIDDVSVRFSSSRRGVALFSLRRHKTRKREKRAAATVLNWRRSEILSRLANDQRSKLFDFDDNGSKRGVSSTSFSICFFFWPPFVRSRASDANSYARSIYLLSSTNTSKSLNGVTVSFLRIDWYSAQTPCATLNQSDG